MGISKPNRRRRRACRPSVELVLICLGALGSLPPSVVRGDDTYAANAARLQQMTAEQKEDLGRKKVRFDELSAEEKQRLRDLHRSINADSNSRELTDTVTRYNRWLGNLDSDIRSKLLDIKDPDERIARIKELMQQQEERRFHDLAPNLPEDDRRTIYSWLGEFVTAHADTIRDRLPPTLKKRIDDAPDSDAKRRELFGSWLRWRRELELPFPAGDDYTQLLKKLSADTRKQLESAASTDPEQQTKRVADLVRAALYSRYFPRASQDELLKFYADMKADDPRRQSLQGLEGEALHRRLDWYFNSERMGGPGSGWGRRGGGRFDGKDRGPSEPPAAALPPSGRQK
jgi:hypothetical protein